MRIRFAVAGIALILHSSVSWAEGPEGAPTAIAASKSPAPPPADTLEDCNLGIRKQEAVVRAAKDEDWDREQAKLEQLERERDIAFPRRSQAVQVAGIVLIVLGLATVATGGVALGTGGSGSKSGFPDLSGAIGGGLIGIGASGVLLGSLVTVAASQRVPKPRRGVSLMLSPTGVGLGGLTSRSEGAENASARPQRAYPGTEGERGLHSREEVNVDDGGPHGAHRLRDARSGHVAVAPGNALQPHDFVPPILEFPPHAFPPCDLESVLARPPGPACAPPPRRRRRSGAAKTEPTLFGTAKIRNKELERTSPRGEPGETPSLVF